MGKGQKQREQINHYNISITPASIIWVFLIGLLFFTAYVLRDLLLVILTSVLLASAISPAARWFQKRKVPRIVAVLILYVGFILSFAGAFYFLLIPLLQEFFVLIKALPDYLDTFESWLPYFESNSAFESISLFGDFAGDLSPTKIIKEIQEILAGLSQGFISTLFSLFGGFLNFVLIVVLSFYLSVQENGVAKFLKMVTPAKNSAYVLDLWKRAEIKIGSWMQGQLILAIIVAVMVYLCLLLLGIPNALLLAVLSGMFELIPVFGPILAAIPAIAIATVEGGNFMGPGLTIGLVVAGMFVIIQQFESQLIYPLVIRKVIGLSPIIVIIALIAGYQLVGFLGVILSVPIAAIVLEFMKDMRPNLSSNKNSSAKLVLNEATVNNQK